MKYTYHGETKDRSEFPVTTQRLSGNFTSSQALEDLRAQNSACFELFIASISYEAGVINFRACLLNVSK